ncbi:MAG: kelch motif-containing protein [Phycisphaerales bacterium]|nr:kelch motif-containing protein [Phycisphaerales bacterium]
MQKVTIRSGRWRGTSGLVVMMAGLCAAAAFVQADRAESIGSAWQAAGVAVKEHMGPVYRPDSAAMATSAARPDRTGAAGRGGCGDSWNAVLDSMPTSSDCIAYDQRRRVTVLANASDTWEYDGTTWTQVHSGANRGSVATLVYDPIGQRCLYFGGYFNTQLWSWDGEAWTLLSDSPVAQRVYAAAAFDVARNRLVIHGGYDSGSTLYQDTWEWNPQTSEWTQTPTSAVGALYAHRMVYDEARGQCVMHGGYAWGNRPETWAWNGSSWTQITPSGPARYVFSMAYDRRGQRTHVSGGTHCCPEFEYAETWMLDSESNSWSFCDSSTPARGYTNMAYDGYRNTLVFAGGIGPAGGGRETIPQTWERSLGEVDPCPSDIDGDFDVDFDDILEIIEAWDQVDPVADIDGSGSVDTNDILQALADWDGC